MSATGFPSIDNRTNRSLPKFGDRCTINRPVGPLGIGVGVGFGLALASVAQLETTIALTKTKMHEILPMKFLLISSVYNFPRATNQ